MSTQCKHQIVQSQRILFTNHVYFRTFLLPGSSFPGALAEEDRHTPSNDPYSKEWALSGPLAYPPNKLPS